MTIAFDQIDIMDGTQLTFLCLVIAVIVFLYSSFIHPSGTRARRGISRP